MERLVAEFRNAVGVLQALDVDTLADEELSELVVALRSESARLDAARVAVTGAWDARGVWDHEGAKSGAAWIAHRTRCPRGVADGEVRLARRLRSMPATKAALEAGEISADHARRLARANRPGLEDAFRPRRGTPRRSRQGDVLG